MERMARERKRVERACMGMGICGKIKRSSSLISFSLGQSLLPLTLTEPDVLTYP